VDTVRNVLYDVTYKFIGLKQVVRIDRDKNMTVGDFMDAMSSGDPVHYIREKSKHVCDKDLHDTFCTIWCSMSEDNFIRKGMSVETLKELHDLTKPCYQSATATQRMVLGDLHETIRKCIRDNEYFWYE